MGVPLYDRQEYEKIERVVWAEICEREQADPLPEGTFYARLTELNMRIHKSDMHLQYETRRRMGERGDHIMLGTTLYSRAYILANLHEFVWSMTERGGYPAIIEAKWPEVAQAGRQHLQQQQGRRPPQRDTPQPPSRRVWFQPRLL